MTPQSTLSQIFTPGTNKFLIRAALITVGLVALVLLVAFVTRLVKKVGGSGSTSGDNGGGQNSPVVLPENLRRLATKLKENSGFLLFPCSSGRCKTLLEMADLQDAELAMFAGYYKQMYGQSVGETLDGFTISGCCFEGDDDVTDAKLENLQKRVAEMGI